VVSFFPADSARAFQNLNFYSRPSFALSDPPPFPFLCNRFLPPLNLIFNRTVSIPPPQNPGFRQHRLFLCPNATMTENDIPSLRYSPQHTLKPPVTHDASTTCRIYTLCSQIPRPLLERSHPPPKANTTPQPIHTTLHVATCTPLCPSTILPHVLSSRSNIPRRPPETIPPAIGGVVPLHPGAPARFRSFELNSRGLVHPSLPNGNRFAH